MKIYLAIKYHHDLSNKKLIEELSNHLSSLGHQVFCVHRDLEMWGEKEFSPEDLMKGAFEYIDSCDLTLIEFSEKGVGLGIEAGYTFAKGKSVITIAKSGSDISTTIRGVSDKIIEYQAVSEINI